MTTGQYKLCIAEILKAAARMEGRTRGLSREDFLRDRARVVAAGDDLALIGRAVDRLPGKIRRRYPAIDWDAWPVTVETAGDALWETATKRVPAFGRQVGLILFDITD